MSGSVLEVVQLTYGYKKPLGEGLNFCLPSSSFLAVIGPNGVGKSAFLRTLLGVIAPLRGEVRYSFPLSCRAQNLAYLPQHPVLPLGLRVEEVVELGRFPRRRWGLGAGGAVGDRGVVWEAMERAGILELRGRMASRISGGERQRMHIAQLLAQDPCIFLLDEPLTHLDLGQRCRVLDLLGSLREEGKVVVATFHDLEVVSSVADWVLLLKPGGGYIFGEVEEVLSLEHLREAFGDISFWEGLGGRFSSFFVRR
ncbi:MAG: ABC transporter ATP-binding protein [Planctomycetota bacterium]|nr:MAG: ABC transporter ATP-binding protein [Planctomycetota bacterium]